MDSGVNVFLSRYKLIDLVEGVKMAAPNKGTGGSSQGTCHGGTTDGLYLVFP